MNPVQRLGMLLRHELRTLRGALYHRLYLSRHAQASVVDAFHRLYFDARAFNMTWRNTYWMGHQILKCPLDLWLYQEILHDRRPDLIVETGTAFGGSALYLASLCDLLGAGEVMTIDIEDRPGRPQHPRITYVTGSSVAPDIRARVASHAARARTVMVILDSDHAKDHVRAELEAYAPLVTPESFLIVEDSNLNGHPVEPAHGPGPMEAIDEFLPRHPEFEIDRTKEKFLLSFNPRGYLRKAR